MVGTDTGLYAQADPSNTASIDDFESNLITTYPNPVNSENYLSITYDFEIQNPTFRITSLQGKLIKEYQKNYVVNSNNKSKIKIENISKGVYLLSMYSKKKKIITKKIIIE